MADLSTLELHDIDVVLAARLNNRGEDRPSDLPLVGAAADASSQTAPSPSASTQPASDPLLLIERLAELQAKGAITNEEFVAKKAELLRRL